MAYYNGKRIFTKIILNGVPRYAKIMLTVGEETTDTNLNALVTQDTLYLTGENASITNDVLNIVNNEVSVSNETLYI